MGFYLSWGDLSDFTTASFGAGLLRLDLFLLYTFAFVRCSYFCGGYILRYGPFTHSCFSELLHLPCSNSNAEVHWWWVWGLVSVISSNQLGLKEAVKFATVSSCSRMLSPYAYLDGRDPFCITTKILFAVFYLR